MRRSSALTFRRIVSTYAVIRRADPTSGGRRVGKIVEGEVALLRAGTASPVSLHGRFQQPSPRKRLPKMDEVK